MYINPNRKIFENLIASGLTPDQALAKMGIETPNTYRPSLTISESIRADKARLAASNEAIAKLKKDPAALGLRVANTPTANTVANTVANNTTANTVANTVANNTTGGAKGSFLKPGGFFDPKTGKLAGFFNKATNPQLDYSTSTGLQAYGKNLGSMYNVGNLGLQAYNAFKGLQNTSKVRDSKEKLVSDIVLAAANSPTVGYDLSGDQLRLLRELQRGAYDDNADASDVDIMGVLGDAAMGALTGLPGGGIGAAIGGIGGAVNSVIKDLGAAETANADELEALYQAVLESERYHQDQRKQRAYRTLY